MKKLLSSICIIIFVCACGNNGTTNSKSLEDTKYGDWVIGNFINDFDEPTGEKYIRQVIFGSFSNSATASSELRVVVFIHKDRTGLTGEIRFDEYADGVIEKKMPIWPTPARGGSKIIDKTNRKVYYNYAGHPEFYDEEESKAYSWIDIFQVPSTYNVTIKGEYKTEYRFTINTENMDLALKDAGLILEAAY